LTRRLGNSCRTGDPRCDEDTRLAALALSSFAPRASAENAAPSPAVKNGDKIAFLGDSITAGGAAKNGYVTLVMEALKSEGLDVSSVPAGQSGNRSSDMLARLDADVISKQPQWLLLSCGVNDVCTSSCAWARRHSRESRWRITRRTSPPSLIRPRRPASRS